MNTPQPKSSGSLHPVCSALPRSPTAIAKDWLLKENEEWFGPRPKWTSSQIEAHQKDLGLLFQFVTDCWPNEKLRD